MFRSMARTAWHGFMAATDEIVDHGTFTSLGAARPFGEINALFR